MNGDLGKVYKAIMEIKVDVKGISVRQDERHKENTKKIDSLFTKAESAITRPCVDHKTVKATLGWHAKWIFFIATAIIGIALKVTLWP